MEQAAQLEAEYCPPIDPALLFAIASDFDLTKPGEVSSAKETLDQLKESASLEEATDFVPSGAGNDHSYDDADSNKDKSTLTSSGADTSITDTTSLSNDLAALDVADESTKHEDVAPNLEDQDEATKMLLLIDVFGENVSERTIQEALRNSNGSWNAAMEELLNQVYFNDAECSDTGEKLVTKGIDGFAEERIPRRKRRQRNRTRRSSASSDTSASESSMSSQPSKWQISKNDVDFIASRTKVLTAVVRLKYNQCGASIPQTINALLKEEMKAHKEADTPENIHLAKELGDDFPTVAEHYRLSLIRIAHPSTANAHELAKALVKRTAGQSSSIMPQYARPTNDDIDGTSWEIKSGKPRTTATLLGAESYAAARAQAFSQANAAHRRAKSNRLMGGAAAYYSQLGRDYSALSHTATASAADALANSQSTSSQVDLHGVDVLNGVRIAQEKIEQWWAGLGENRANGRIGAGQRSAAFRIVVGRGTHSEGGKSKLGPAVTKMLKSEGWRFENEGAIIAVKGKLKP